MKKLKLFGLGNNDERSYFIFEKSLDFFSLFSDFLTKLGMQKSGSFYDYENDSIDLEETIDIVENMSDKNYDIDIFYGKNKIIVVIRSVIEREYVINLIKEFSDLEGS
jgi:hypothetical protein